MKKTLIGLLLLLALPLAAPAQTYIPKHEFSVYLSVADNRLLCASDADINFFCEGRYMAAAFPFGLEYTRHITPRWGISTGASLAIHYSGAQRKESTEWYPLDAEPFLDEIIVGKRYRHTGWIESDLGALYLNIPVLANFTAPITERLHFYTQAGLKFGITLTGPATESSYGDIETDDIVYNYDAASIDYRPDIVFTDDSDTFKYNGAAELRKFNLFSSIETGVRFSVRNSFGIYLGAFVDLGMIPMAKRSHTPRLADGKVTATSFSADAEKAELQITDIQDETFTHAISVIPSKERLISPNLPLSAGLRVKFAF